MGICIQVFAVPGSQARTPPSLEDSLVPPEGEDGSIRSPKTVSTSWIEAEGGTGQEYERDRDRQFYPALRPQPIDGGQSLSRVLEDCLKSDDTHSNSP